MTRPTDPGHLAFRTHEVSNMVPALVDSNLFTDDKALGEAIVREGAGWASAALAELGERLGKEETIELGFLANRHPPVLHTHDRSGHRRDEVEYHPAWHALLGLSVEHGLHASPWADPRPGAHVARAAGIFLLAQVEAGVMCPTTMTYASVPALRRQPEIAAQWEPRILSRRYDRRFRPAVEKTGVLLGMGMTEKQGGSDLRANTTRAAPVGGGGPGGEYRIVGHKWFFSAPMSDAFLVTAQAPGGLSCFLLPRWTSDGALNGVRLQRLKDKLGNRANASSEVEFHNAWALLVGEEGRGLPVILEMVEPRAPRLRRGQRVADAPGALAGRVPRRPPERLPAAPHRPAADAPRARRPDRRVGGGDRPRHAPRARLRRLRGQGRRARGGVLPRHDPGDQVLHDQARARLRGRGPRGAGRDRLRRGVDHAAALPGGPAELHLGGVGERDVSRRPPGPSRAARARTRSSRSSRWPAGRTRGSTAS